LNFQWSIGAFQTFKCMDGTQVFTGISEQGLSAALAMTVMVDSSFSSLVTKYLNQSRLLVRLENLGSLIHGSSNTYKRLRLDGGYVLRNIAEIGGSDEAGKQTVSLEFESEYDIDEGLYYEVECAAGGGGHDGSDDEQAPHPRAGRRAGRRPAHHHRDARRQDPQAHRGGRPQRGWLPGLDHPPLVEPARQLGPAVDPRGSDGGRRLQGADRGLEPRGRG
jgi:hypothetical protein